MGKINEVLENQGYRNIKKRILIALLVLILAVIIFIIMIWYVYPRECANQECFKKAMATCKRVSWIREDSRASWYYKIIGSAPNDACKINVKLLMIKQGTIDIEDLQGYEMTCTLLKGDDRFPEENMEKCTGTLKEQLQAIIIERMHDYLLKNLGEIKEGFGV